MTLTSIRWRGPRDRKGRVGRLRSSRGSALVRAALDTTAPLFAGAVLASVNKAVLDATTARSTFVALFAGLLAVDTGILDLLTLGADASALKCSVTVLMRHKVCVMALEVTARHHVGMAHLVCSVELSVGVHLR